MLKYYNSSLWGSFVLSEHADTCSKPTWRDIDAVSITRGPADDSTALFVYQQNKKDRK